MSPPVRFVLLCAERTGSNLVTFGLDENPAVEMFGEIFHETEADEQQRCGLPPDIPGYRPGGDAGEFLSRRIFQSPGRRPILARGFKMFYGHARSSAGARSAWTYLLGDRDLRVIHLARRNLLEAFSSLESARRSDRWFERVGQAAAADAPGPVEPFPLDPWDCQEYFCRVTAWRLWAERAFGAHPRLDLDYQSDLQDDFAGAMARVFDFIGVPAMAIQPALVKQQQRPLSAQITNYQELRESFRYTLFESFFDPAGAAA
jgi:hypothetical protein